MADVKISDLPLATTPVGGTEVMPLVQSGVTVKAAINNIAPVRSVNSKTGIVVINSDDVAEGTTNKYFSNANVRDAISVTQNLTYDNTTGVITGPDLSSYLQDFDIGITVQEYNVNTVVDPSYVHTDNNYTTAEKTKLSTIEDNADITDAVNVAAAGAIMDGDFTTNGLMKRSGAGTYSIITDNSSEWDTAYSWGNHATAGYLNTSDIDVNVQAYSLNLDAWSGISTSAKQDTLVSGTNIKTLNGNSILGSGDLIVGAGTVTSVDMTVPTGLSVSGVPITTSGTIEISLSTGYAIPTTIKQGQWDTAYGWGDHALAGYVVDASYVHTDNNYTTTEKSKLAGIEAGAEVNVNADWNAIGGDAQILNKPTLGTAAAANTTDFATAAQGTLADSAVQPAVIANMLETSDIGVSVQAYDADLTSWAGITPSSKQDAITSVGILKGSGSSVSAATSNTDYLVPALANTAVTGFKTATFNSQTTIATTSGSITVDWTSAQNQLQTEPTGTITYTFTAPPGPCHMQLVIDSDGTSTAQTINWPGTVTWLGTTWAGANNKKAVINFWYDGTNYFAIGTNQA